MTTTKDPKAMTTKDPRWLTWYVQQRRFERIKHGGYTAPSLVLSFENEAYQMGAKNTPPDYRSYSDLITFARASGGGITNAAGQFEWVGNNVPRITYDPVTLKRLGQLIEEQRTNLLLNSVLAGGTSGVVGAGAVAPTGWSFSGPTPNGEITYAATPFGTLGVRFQATAQRPAFGRSVTALANTLYSYHARITALVGSVEIQNAVWAVGFPVDAVRTFWRNGVTVAGNTIVAAGDHVAVIVTMGATAGTFGARFGAGAQTNATCDVTMTMPQVEAGFPSSYIPTEGSKVTRAADVCSVNTLSPWYNPLEGTLVVEGIPNDNSAAVRGVACLDDGTASNRMQLRYDSAQRANFLVVAGGSVQAGTFGSASNSWPVGTRRKAAMSYAADAFAFSSGGEPTQTDTNGTVPTVNRLSIGFGPNAPTFNGIIASISYYPRIINVQQASA